MKSLHFLEEFAKEIAKDLMLILGGKITHWKLTSGWAVVAQAFNPITWEAEAGGFLISIPAWSTEWVPGQPGLHRETLSRTNETKQNKKQKQQTKKENLMFELTLK